MTEDAPALVIAVAATALAALALGWFARSRLTAHAHRRRQEFFGLPDNSECVLVVSRDTGTDGAVARNDVMALLELSAVVKNCGARAQLISGETARQGFGERTEFCLGSPVANRRSAAHLHSLLPGVSVNTDADPGPDRGRSSSAASATGWRTAPSNTSSSPASPPDRRAAPSSSPAASAPSPTRPPPATWPATTPASAASTARAAPSSCC